MKWDFSIRQRAEDRLQSDQQWAAQQRLLKQIRVKADEDASTVSAGQRPFLLANWVERLWKRLAGVVGVSALLVVLLTAQAGASSVVELARHLAENVLGQGSVKVIRTSDADRTVLIRWESATYRAHRSLADSRELLYGEALLATGAVLGRLYDVVRVRFTILQGERILATGENSRGKGLQLVFAPLLGGGTYVVPEREASESRKSGGGHALQPK